jgi:hypothetical protein
MQTATSDIYLEEEELLGNGDNDEDDDELSIWALPQPGQFNGDCREMPRQPILGEFVLTNGVHLYRASRQLHHGQCLDAVRHDDEHANDDVQGRVRTKTVKRASRVLIEK